MESKELRIGNLVWGVSDRIEVISEIQRDKIETVFRGHLYNYCTIDDIAPIEISPEILLKAGFEFSHDNEYYAHYKNSNNLYISMAKQDVPFGFYARKNCWYIGDNHTEIPNLHWLQNFVYFTFKFELVIIL